MRVGIVHPKRNAVAGTEQFLAVIGHEHQFAGNHDHDLVVGLMPVALRRPGARAQFDSVNTELRESVLPRQRPSLATAARLIMGRRIARPRTAFWGSNCAFFT